MVACHHVALTVARLIHSEVLRISLFLVIAMPSMLVAIGAAFALVVAPLEEWRLLPAFGFTASAITGGSIQIEGSSLTPHGFFGKLVALLVGSAGVGLFGFMVAMLSALVPASMSDVLRKVPIHNIIGQLVVMLLCILVILLLSATLLGSLIFLFSDIEHHGGFRLAWNTVASAELGGGLPIDVMHSHLIFTDVLVAATAMWGIGAISIIVSFARSIIAERLKRHAEAKTHGRVFTSVLVVVPAAIFLAMTFFALVATLCGSEASFEQLFWWALPAVSGGSAVVYNPPAELDAWHQYLVVCISPIGFFIVNIGIALGSGTADVVFEKLGVLKHYDKSLRHALGTFCFTITVLIPALVVLTSLPLGGAMAVANDWKFMDAFWWCVAVQLGGGMVISNPEFSSRWGRLVGVLVAAWSIGVSSFSIGLSTAPAVEPLIDWLWQQVEYGDCGCMLPFGASEKFDDEDSESANSDFSD